MNGDQDRRCSSQDRRQRKGQQGQELAEMEDMLDAGAVAFSDDGKPVAVQTES